MEASREMFLVFWTVLFHFLLCVLHEPIKNSM
jgi:hypothetical protein